MKIKKAAAALALLVVALCAWLGASIYTGRSASQAIIKIANTSVFKPFVYAFGTNSKVTLVEHKHEQGLFSSTGQITLRFKRDGSFFEADPLNVDILVDYRASNFLLPNAFMRVDWTAKPIGEIGKIISQHFEKEITLTGEAKQDYSGKVMSTLHLSEIVGLPIVDDQLVRLIVPPSTGFVSWKDQAMTFDWKTERISFLTEDGTVVKGLEGLSASVDLLDKMLGVGTIQVAVAKWQTAANTVGKGYSLKYAGLARGDRLDVTVNQNADEIVIGGRGYLLSDLVFDVSWNDLDSQSVVELNKYLSQYAEEDDLSIEDEARMQASMRASMRKIIDKGFKFSVAKISAKYQETTESYGSKKKADVNGKMVLEVLKAETNATFFDVAKSLRFSGELIAKGSAVDAETGIFYEFSSGEKTEDGMKLSIDFNGTTLTFHGKKEPDDEVSDRIESMNSKINSEFYQ